MNTIWALKPGIKLFRVCGYCPLEISDANQLQLSAKYRYYTIFLLCIFTALLAFSFVFQDLENYVESTVNYILLILVYVTQFFTLLESATKRQDQLEMLNNFNEIDQILQTRFDHKIQISLRRHLTITIFLFFTVLVVILATDIGILLHNSTAGEFNYLAYYFVAYSLSSIRYFQIIYYTWMIKKRLNFLNKTLLRLVRQKNAALKTVSFSTIKTIRFLNSDLGLGKNSVAPFEEGGGLENVQLTGMDVLRDVYNRLWQNSQLFNQVFGLSLLVNLGYDFMSLTTNVYWIVVSYSTVVANTSPTPGLFGKRSK